MVNSIYVKDFKSIDEYTFILGKLNLLAGPNSSGKSSTIQSLLLASDNLRDEEKQSMLTSRHSVVPSFNEIRNYINNAKSYVVGIDNVELSFSPGDDAMIKTSVQQRGVPANELKELLSCKLLYLPAMRNADNATTNINMNPDENPLGRNGEYVIDYLYNHKDSLLPDTVYADDTSRTLLGQVNLWLNRLTGYTIKISLDGSEYKVRYVGVGGKELHPRHIGTGVSFITGVIIVCLASTIDGGFVIIENPEIHLHPAAQADLIDFISLVSTTDVQLMIETHSDHLFNGIRRLLHKRKLKIDDVFVYNFKRIDNGTSSIRKITLSQEGGIVDYEPDLFEQFDKDLDDILS